MRSDNINSEFGGFFKLYAINKRSKNDKGRHRGLNSPFGRRMSICSHLHVDWFTLNHCIPFAIIQRGLIDAPSFETEEEEQEFELRDDNVDEVYNLLNSM